MKTCIWDRWRIEQRRKKGCNAIARTIKDMHSEGENGKAVWVFRCHAIAWAIEDMHLQNLGLEYVRIGCNATARTVEDMHPFARERCNAIASRSRRLKTCI